MKLRIHFTGLIIALSICVCSKAQTISGIVTDGEQKPMNGSSVSLLKSSDSSVVKWTVTQKDGHFSFLAIKPGRYIIAVTQVNYKKGYSGSFELKETGDNIIPAIVLSPLPKSLSAVTVTSKKPIIEVKADKTILNVEGTINATGSDALELLRKSPGVLVDKDENIGLNGKNGVQIYIDGRPTPLSGKDLSDYLKAIQSSQIESIEIISNPSAKYEAAGNAGIINIRLKKNKSLGTNGSVTTGYSIGTYPKYNGGLSINHRNKKINLFANYNLSSSKNKTTLDIDRVLLDTFFNQRTVIKINPTSNSFKVGLDFFANKRSTLGFLVNGFVFTGDLLSDSRTNIIYNPSSVTDRILQAYTQTRFKRNNYMANLNYAYTDTSGRSLNIDADFGTYRNNTNQYQPNYYYNAAGTTELSRVIYRMISPSNIDLYTFKSDYEQNFKKGKLGIGGKLSYIISDNDFSRYNVFPSGNVLDTLKSNHFIYKENINALYVNYTRSFKGFIIQFGVRMENTVSKGYSTGYYRLNNGTYMVYDSSFKRNYTNLFPSAAITFNKNPATQWSISYSRRIDRPSYQNLNPFEFKLDEYTSQKGNTRLTPQYTNSFSITNTYKYKFTSTVNYSHVRDIFTQIFDTTEKSKAFMTQENIATQNIVSLNMSYPLQLKWYSAFINLNTYYSHYKSNFGSGRVIDLDVWSLSLLVQSSFKLSKGWTGELTGVYSSPSISQGAFRVKTLWGVDAGFQKALFKGRANMRLVVSDIFYSQKVTAVTNFAGQSVNNHISMESRLFKLSFTYRFGSMQVKAARQRKTSADEEAKRAQVTQ